MTLKEMKEKLGTCVGDDPTCLTKSKGIFTLRREFFYTHGRTSNHLVQKLRSILPEAIVLDHGEVWKPFRGSACTRDSSHWFVKFRVS